jgi:hypothetical protein
MMIAGLALRALALISLCFYLFSSETTPRVTHSLAQGVTHSAERFIKLDSGGHTLYPRHPPPDKPTGQIWDCVRDRNTNLVWEVKTTHGLRHHQNTYTWYNPDAATNGGEPGVSDAGHCIGSKCDTDAYIKAINHMRLCGRRNWRLPSRGELRSIADYRQQPPHAAINLEYFSNTVAQFYWSATPDANAMDSAWGIGFTFGYDYSYFKSDLGYVRLVSSEGTTTTNNAQHNRFEILADAMVIDRHSQLVWSRCSVGQRWDKDTGACAGKATLMTWYQANKLGNGWRLPSVHELSSIADLHQVNPAIDRQVFPNTPASHYWTDTAFAPKPGYFWLVQFQSGENHTDSGKRLAFVRLVRPWKN